MKNVAKALCGFSLTELVYGGGIGGSDILRKTERKDEIVTIAKELGIYDETHEELIENFIRFHTWDFFSRIDDALYDQRAVTELRVELINKAERHTINYPSRSDLEKLFQKYNIELEMQANEVVEYYLYYLEHQKPMVSI